MSGDYDAALSNRVRASWIAARFARAHEPSSLTGSSSERPSGKLDHIGRT